MHAQMRVLRPGASPLHRQPPPNEQRLESHAECGLAVRYDERDGWVR